MVHMYLFLFVSLINPEGNKVKNILKQSIEAIKDIESIEYTTYNQSSPAFDTTIFVRSYYEKTRAIRNSEDTLNAFSLTKAYEDTTEIQFAYDGIFKVDLFPGKKHARVINYLKEPEKRKASSYAPFFVTTRTIFEMALTSSEVETKIISESSESYKIEFFYPNNRYEFSGTQIEKQGRRGYSSSRYIITINKEDFIPLIYDRMQEHQKTKTTLVNYRINDTNIRVEKPLAIIPDDYSISNKRSVSSFDKNKYLNKKVPDWVLSDINGRKIRLSDYFGSIVLLEFTSLGCGPCHAIIPTLKKMQEDFNERDFQIISLESFLLNGKIETFRKYAEKKDLNYPFLVGSNEVIDDYDVRGVPHFLLIDRKGIVREVIFGSNNIEKVRQAVSELL